MHFTLTLFLLSLAVSTGQSEQMQTEHTQLEEEWGWIQPDEIDEYDYDNGDEDEYQEEENEDTLKGDNIDAIDEDEQSCEYSCPRYYRPVCARRDGKLVTYATPCEFHNELRCASVLKRQGMPVPRYEYLFNGPCF